MARPHERSKTCAHVRLCTCAHVHASITMESLPMSNQFADALKIRSTESPAAGP